MVNRLLQYKRMIGEAIGLTKQNNELAKQNNELAKQNNELAEQNNELTRQKYEHLAYKLERLELQMQLQHEIVAVNTAAFSEYKNVHTGKEIVIVATGPTLNQYTPMENVIHIGVNKVCTNKKIKLDYYFTQDFGQQVPRSVPYEKDILELQCKKFFGLLADASSLGAMEPSESFGVRANATRYFVDVSLDVSRGTSSSKYLYSDIRFHPLMDFFTVVFPALHFALFTNPKRIYLVGCDTNHNGYFTNEAQKDSIEEARIYLYNRMIGYRRVKAFAQKWYPETEIVSINPVNLKGIFKDIYTDEQDVPMEDDESANPADERDFSDESIRRFVDGHLEQALLNRVEHEASCKECGKRNFSLLRGLSDEHPSQIEINCDFCNVQTKYPPAFGSAETLFLKPVEGNARLRLVHIGLHENSNAGDTLLFPVIRSLLQDHLCPIDFTLMNLRANVTQEMIDVINAHDGVIIGGGGLFLKDTNPNQVSGWQWACPEDLLRKINVPIVVFAVGNNRFRGQDDFDDVFRQNVNTLVDKAAFFSLRSNGSLESLKGYIDPALHHKLIFQPCPTTVLSKCYPYEVSDRMDKNILGLNIPFDRQLSRYESKEDSIFKAIAEAVKEMEAMGWKVVLLNHFDMDREAAVWLEKYGVALEQVNLHGVHPDKVIELYNRFGAVIGGRGHAQMIPFGLEIPTFSLISHDKLRYFLDEIEHPEWGEEVLSPLLKEKLMEFAEAARANAMKKELEEAQAVLWQTTKANMEKLAETFNL